MSTPSLPTYKNLLWPTLQAVKALGGSGAIGEIADETIRQEEFSEEQQAVLHREDGPQTEIQYRMGWARTHLKGMGLLDNSQRGVWSLTDRGRKVDESDIEQLHATFQSRRREERRRNRTASQSQPRDYVVESEEPEAQDWQDILLETLWSLSPDSFERLAQRLLREAGFVSVNVTGRSGDGGIDGQGMYRLSLMSFPVFFQCKRYRGSVGSSAVRDFRGAMAGRGDKGLLIATGTFTTDAKAEAVRAGAPPIDLIDGRQLCELLKQYELGVQTIVRPVEDVSVDEAFFKEM